MVTNDLEKMSLGELVKTIVTTEIIYDRLVSAKSVVEYEGVLRDLYAELDKREKTYSYYSEASDELRACEENSHGRSPYRLVLNNRC